MGAICIKIEPPAGRPDAALQPRRLRELHDGVTRASRPTSRPSQARPSLHRELARADVLLTSFRPSALTKLGLDWPRCTRATPAVARWRSSAAPGERPRCPATTSPTWPRTAWCTGTDLPATLFADMGGSLMASEAVLQAALLQAERYAGAGDAHPQGRYFEVALSDAAAYLALPRALGPDAAGRRGGRRPCRLPRLSLRRRPGRRGGAGAALRRAPCAQRPAWPTSGEQAMFTPATHEADRPPSWPARRAPSWTRWRRRRTSRCTRWPDGRRSCCGRLTRAALPRRRPSAAPAAIAPAASAAARPPSAARPAPAPGRSTGSHHAPVRSA